MRAHALIAVVTAAGALAACRPDYPPQPASDPHYTAPHESQHTPSPTTELSAAPPPSATEANGPPTVIIQPMR
jgi:hypothetical protein